MLSVSHNSRKKGILYIHKNEVCNGCVFRSNNESVFLFFIFIILDILRI